MEEVAPDPVTQIVESSIERHGGPLFESSRIGFTFRGARFEVERVGGRFRHSRRYADSHGRSVVEVMDNDGTRKEVDGAAVPLGPDERAATELAVNSVVYFAFLPFRLGDPAVRLRSLGAAEVHGAPYEKVEVTFHREGGGVDWDDRFVYWIHADDHTLDYLAHRYHRDGGGIRFRRAVNRRENGGLLVQDYENYRPVGEVADIADLDRRFEAGDLELLSLIELEEVEVAPIAPRGGNAEASLDSTDARLRDMLLG
ncbi:MAG: DUF6503 family protein [Gemmatimonadota bacterium]